MVTPQSDIRKSEGPLPSKRRNIEEISLHPRRFCYEVSMLSKGRIYVGQDRWITVWRNAKNCFGRHWGIGPPVRVQSAIGTGAPPYVNIPA